MMSDNEAHRWRLMRFTLYTTAWMQEVEQRRERLPTTAWMQEVEQRRERLPTTAWMQEVEQRRERLPSTSYSIDFFSLPTPGRIVNKIR